MPVKNLFSKYNIPGPRYTSYPTVPFWTEPPSKSEWENEVKFTFQKTNSKEGISIYIHLPFCESLCTYCGCNTRITVNHAVEKMYINAVLKEWALYLELFEEKPRIKELHLGGGTPTFFSPENLQMLIHSILSSATRCPESEFSFEAHPNNTTEEHLKTLYALGFKRISIGVQDFDPVVQEIVNRVQPFEHVKRLTDWSRKIGFTSINFDLIYGLPKQTKAGIITTIEKVSTLLPDRIAFYSYAHIPWIKPGQRKFTEADLPANEEKLELYETGRQMLALKGYEEIGMDHFALPTDSLYHAKIEKHLHRNFMGYNSHSTRLLIGLGVSSISDSWTAFIQNEKKVEDYYKRVDENTLPFFKGHLLSKEDTILRKHILNIMCYGYTSWEQEHEQFETLERTVQELKEFEKDGLLRTEKYGVQILQNGLPFIRNICMAFDARMRNNESNKVRLSQTI